MGREEAQEHTTFDPKDEEEVIMIIDGPYGPIEVISVKQQDSTALSDLYNTIAEVMVKQAKKKATQR